MKLLLLNISHSKINYDWVKAKESQNREFSFCKISQNNSEIRRPICKSNVCIPAEADTNCLHLMWCLQNCLISLCKMLFSADSLSDSACESSLRSFLIVGFQYLKKPFMFPIDRKAKWKSVQNINDKTSGENIYKIGASMTGKLLPFARHYQSKRTSWT